MKATATPIAPRAIRVRSEWLSGGMAVGGGMVVAVGYAMVINMMATSEVWPFFAIGFAVAAVSDLTLIALGTIGVALAFIYLNLEGKLNATKLFDDQILIIEVFQSCLCPFLVVF